ncbi:hypothetical protein BDA96_02G448200 [Sorghum bicolor]|uniref:DUF3615 domain-containing protein n=2 Tax=Sorghum bicolor TaxID=4558 RepID=A0A921UYI7_SORBI|nr:uncharacterized protein LOC8084976 [Sorghum bicolor]EER99959.1 hypothetical protein SORBI_3002G427700 [Sorghum bicolor]KAG0546446.1 hypothetical protein BDA96_02G448200 [Sorghum bicolor]|eukprot:XP_002463438.1 uncharacterized protein LOC8084976 [Sorghum bicolor]
MTGLNGKRKAVETPLAKRPAQHKPQASRRTKRTKEPALPRKRESSTARAPLADGRDEYASVSYSLRNRIVYVPIPKNTSKHIVPSTSEPAPPESDFRKEPKYRQSNQTSTCAQMGLEHYNSMNQGDEHELVKAVDSNSVIFNGVWIHANFLAKRKGATTCPDLVPKYFFTEVKCDYNGLSCLSCVKLDPGVPRKFGGCGVCPPQIMHPVDGGYLSAQPFNPSAPPGNCVMGL